LKDEKNLKISVKTKDTAFGSKMGTVWSETTFSAGTSCEDLIRAINDPETRLLWDKDLEYAEAVSISPDSHCHIWNYV